VNSTTINAEANLTFDGNILGVTGGIGNGGAGRILIPGGAYYQTSNSSVTGAWKIKLPVSRNNSSTMMMMTVRIYQYNTGNSHEIVLGGYNYSGSNWYNLFAYNLTDTGSNYTVRFGSDSTSDCIWIGETNSGWTYPQVFVTDFQGGYSGYDDAWATGWSITAVTSFDTVEQSRTPALMLNTNNYNNYSPTLAGAGASGNWAINVTGTAASISGFNNPTTAATANTIAYRDGSGDLTVRELVLNVAVQSFTPSSMVAIYPTTNQAVKVDAAGARTFLNVPTRTGGDASGTWGISITGSSASTTDALRITFNDGPRNLSDRLPTTLPRSVNWDFVTAGTIGGTGNYGGVMSFTPWTGTTASTGDSSYQLAFMNETGINGSGLPGLRIRKGIDSTWGSWYTLLHADNYNSYSPTLTGTGASGTWGINVTGSSASCSGNSATATYASSAGYATYLPTAYAGGQQTNPQVYFGQGTGLKVAMTGVPNVWSDTLWINGYSGNDVLYMCALHTIRNSQPRMWISSQQSTATAYGSYYEFLTEWNSPYAIRMNQDVRTSDNVLFNRLNLTTSLRYNSSVADDSGFGIYFDSGGSTSYAIYREAGSWSYPYPDLRIAFHTGIKFGANPNYNGMRFYSDYDMSTIVASINDGDSNMRGYYDIIAYASDKRLKEKVEVIDNAIEKVMKLTGMTYSWNDVGSKYGWNPGKEREAGVFAQELQEVLPEAVKLAPFDQDHDTNGNMFSKSGENFLTVKYEKIVPLLIEAVKELTQRIEDLERDR